MLQTTIIAKTTSLLIGGLILMYSGIINIVVDIDKINQSKNEIIQEEIEELLDDFASYAENYIKQLAEEYEDDITQEDIDDFMHEAIENFSYNYENTHRWDGISEKTYNYMKKQLSKNDQKYIDHPLTQYRQEKIMNYFINKQMFD